MSDRQLEFYFMNTLTGESSQTPVTFDYPEPRRTYSQPATEYFRKAFDVQPLGAPVESASTRDFGKTVGLNNERGPWERVQIGYVAPPILSQDSEERKNTPIFSGVLMYFPLAIAAVARHSKRGNDRHNAGEPLHWAREKSTDHHDCAARHLCDVNHYNAQLGEYEEAAALAWRALAILELLEEKRLGRG